jgi:drug/metabolite transporter (DMT)-like permease
MSARTLGARPTPAEGAPGPGRTALLVAFATLYIVWGSTYFAIRIAVMSWPPFVLAAVRFALAGGVLYLFLRLRGAPRPSLRSWGAAALVGALLLGAGNGVLCWAEQWVPSGETALIVATVPLWMTVLPWLARRAPAPPAAVLIGVVLGLGGVATLMGGALADARRGGPASAALLGRSAVLASSLFWSLGSLWSRRLPLPPQPFVATAMEMLTASPLLAVAALASGEWRRFHLSAVTPAGWLALAYLIVLGSIAGFGSYVFLLKHTSAARASTYAFVNPLVAVALGAGAAGEAVGARTVVAALLIVAAVGAVISGSAAARRAEET